MSKYSDVKKYLDCIRMDYSEQKVNRFFMIVKKELEWMEKNKPDPVLVQLKIEKEIFEIPVLCLPWMVNLLKKSPKSDSYQELIGMMDACIQRELSPESLMPPAKGLDPKGGC